MDHEEWSSYIHRNGIIFIEAKSKVVPGKTVVFNVFVRNMDDHGRISMYLITEEGLRLLCYGDWDAPPEHWKEAIEKSIYLMYPTWREFTYLKKPPIKILENI